MKTGYWIIKGDRTSCGGIVLEGDARKTMRSSPVAITGSAATCGKYPGSYFIVGGFPGEK